MALENEVMGLYRKIEELGFAFDKDFKELGGSHGKSRSWSRLRFVMEKQGEIPQIELLVSEHQKHGIGVVIYSNPWYTEYHSYTKRPVSEEEALKFVKEYLWNVKI